MIKDKRIIKFRAWIDGVMQGPIDFDEIAYEGNGWTTDALKKMIWMQYTGLLDKNGKEIYELHEINKKYRVVFNQESASYVLQDISNNDIIPLYALEKKELKITGEYCPIP